MVPWGLHPASLGRGQKGNVLNLTSPWPEGKGGGLPGGGARSKYPQA